MSLLALAIDLFTEQLIINCVLEDDSRGMVSMQRDNSFINPNLIKGFTKPSNGSIFCLTLNYIVVRDK